MARHKWNYSGDVNLRYGGFFWREDDADDYVLALRVTPCSDVGGSDNLFHIEQGSIYLPKDAAPLKNALATIGKTPETATRLDIVYAFMAYNGIDRHSYNGETDIRIGPADKHANPNGWNPKPNVVLRSNASLRNYVRRELLD